MIVDPDFLDHWKTRFLVESLDGDEMAPLYVIRLWGHCQMRRTNIFTNLSNSALKALCRYSGHPNKLESGLLASGFIRREGQNLIVHEWDYYNSTLIASWENGKRGGRPPKPKENPQETHGLPTANPGETDKIGYDKEDKEDKINPPYPLKADDVPIPKELDDPIFRDTWKAWLSFRRSKRKPVSVKAAEEQLKELASWGKASAIESIKNSIKADYQGLFEPKATFQRNGNPRKISDHSKGFFSR